jgi:hypothetical protein
MKQLGHFLLGGDCLPVPTADRSNPRLSVGFDNPTGAVPMARDSEQFVQVIKFQFLKTDNTDNSNADRTEKQAQQN